MVFYILGVCHVSCIRVTRLTADVSEIKVHMRVSGNNISRLCL